METDTNASTAEKTPESVIDITVRDVTRDELDALRPGAQAAHELAGRTGDVSNPVIIRWAIREMVRKLQLVAMANGKRIGEPE